MCAAADRVAVLQKGDPFQDVTQYEDSYATGLVINNVTHTLSQELGM